MKRALLLAGLGLVLGAAPALAVVPAKPAVQEAVTAAPAAPLATDPYKQKSDQLKAQQKAARDNLKAVQKEELAKIKTRHKADAAKLKQQQKIERDKFKAENPKPKAKRAAKTP